MSETLRRVQTLVLAGDVEASRHALVELAKDDIVLADAVAGIVTAVLVEDYPSRARGPSVLTLQHDADGKPLHVVWAIPAAARRPAVLVTGYRPDTAAWDRDFIRRRIR